MSATDWYADAARGGGPIAVLILLIGLAGLAVLVERYWVIVYRSKNNGRAFIERIIPLVRGGKIEDAIKICAGSTAALSDMGLIMLRSRSRDEANLQQLATTAALAIVPRLTHRLQYLKTFATAAVLLGILGTMNGFGVALRSAGSPDAHLLAALGDALGFTVLGLAIAVILTLGRGFLANQAETISKQIYEFSARLINALIDLPDVRLGHR